MDLFDIAVASKLAGGGGGGGGSDWELIYSTELTISTEQPLPPAEVLTIPALGAEYYNKNVAIVCVARKKNFVKEAGKHIGTDSFLINWLDARGETGDLTNVNRGIINYYTDDQSKYMGAISGTTGNGGLCIGRMSSAGEIILTARTVSGWGSMIGTYKIDIYAAKWPNNTAPFSI